MLVTNTPQDIFWFTYNALGPNKISDFSDIVLDGTITREESGMLGMVEEEEILEPYLVRSQKFYQRNGHHQYLTGKKQKYSRSQEDCH